MKIPKMWVVSFSLMTLVTLRGAGQENNQFATLEDVKNELSLLAPISEEKLQLVVEELSSDQFAIRQSARQRLMRAPESWKPFLKDLLDKNEDPELQMSLKQILEKMDPKTLTSASRLARATLVHGHRGLGAEFLEVLPSVVDRRSAEMVIAAARLSVTDEEKETVLKSLSSENALLREGAARVIPALIDDSREALKASLADADGMVRLAAIEAFASLADPACLNPLSEMLNGEDLYLRWRASGMLRQLTDGEITPDPLKPVDGANLDLDKWRAPNALKAWKPTSSPSLIPLFGENEDLSSWVLARGSLADIPVIKSENGHITSEGTGLYTWASPWRFQNYRVSLEWRFVCDDINSNAGFSLAKFQGPPPTVFDQWMRNGALEIEIKTGNSGALYPSGTKMKIKGEKKGSEVKIFHPENGKRADWNTLEVEELDGTLRVWVNGLLQNEVSDLDTALTTFGLRADRSTISWRNFTLQPLPGAQMAPPIEAEEQQAE